MIGSRQIKRMLPGTPGTFRPIGRYLPSTISRRVFPRPTGFVTGGDSRDAGMGNLSGGTSVSVQHNSSGAFEWVNPFFDNKFGIPLNFNYGIASTSTVNLLKRMNSKSVATTGNPAGTLTGNAADSNYNIKSTDAYSLIGHQANVVFILDSVNDINYPSYYTSPLISMQTMSAILDQLSHKTVFLANEFPRGTGISYMESHSVTLLTCTATNTTGFQDGATIGIPGLYNGTTGAIYTKVASLPVVGQYSVTSGGVYTFNVADTITIALLSYTYTTSVTAAYQVTMHYWLASNAANFVDPTSGTVYGIPGALYRRPWVISYKTWEAAVDPATGNTSLRGSSVDGLHPSSYGSQLIARNNLALLNSIWPSLPSHSHSPTKNNQQFAIGDGSTKTFTCTLPASMLPVAAGSLKIFLSSSSSVAGRDNGSGTFTGTGISAGTINYSTGALSVTFTAAPANNGMIFCYADSSNPIDNGMCDYGAVLGTNAATGTGASGTVPKPWTATVSNLGGCTATFSADTDTDGYPAIKIVLQTVTGVMGTTPTVQLLTAFRQTWNQYTPNGAARSVASIKIGPGPDGHLYGITGFPTQITIHTTSTSKGSTSGVTAVTMTCMQGSASYSMTDLDLVPGGGFLKYVGLSPSCDCTGFSSSTATLAAFVGLVTGQPVSATIWISRVAMIQTIVGSSQEY